MTNTNETSEGIAAESGLVEASRATAEGSSAVGNCAKMRRVCEQMLELLKAPPGFNDGGMSVELDEEQVVMWRERFLAALASPARNCDVGSVVEQNKRFVEYCKGHRIKIIGHVEVCDSECPCRKGGDLNLCALRWAQKPYEEGGKK